MRPLSKNEQLQKNRFDSSAQDYKEAHGDVYSQRYRKEFIYDRLLPEGSFENRNVLDAMCGNGEATGYLLQSGAKVTALDISSKEIQHLKETYPGVNAKCASILSSGLPSNTFDIVVIIGGLHHVHPHVIKALEEIRRVLKTGGYLCFFEPHKGSLLDLMRKTWYQWDKRFVENEESIDLKLLKEKFDDRFEFRQEIFMGSIAYMFVYNSLIWGLPLWIKKIYTPLFIALERIISPLLTKLTAPAVIGCWKKI